MGQGITSSGGGAFNIYETNDTSNGVLTFCIERDEFLASPMKIDVISNKSSTRGKTSDSSPALSFQAAYLYNKWFTEIAPTAAIADAYQAVIWYYEGELNEFKSATDLYGYNYLGNTLYADTLRALAATATTYEGVVVLNLNNLSGRSCTESSL